MRPNRRTATMPSEARGGWRLLRIVLWLAAGVAVAALLFGIQSVNRQAAVTSYGAMFGGPFTLTDTQGRTVTEASLKGVADRCQLAPNVVGVVAGRLAQQPVAAVDRVADGLSAGCEVIVQRL